jgi:CBS domain-containing protein
MGYSVIDDTLNGRFAVSALAALFVAKLMSWWISLGSQTSGGTLAPMFIVGAAMGNLLGHATNVVVPDLHVSPSAFALVAMGATFGAATKALFASVVFAAEVTGEYTMIVPLMVGVAVAELVAELFLTDRLMTEKLSHRGFRVDFRTEVGALRMRVAHQIMRAPVCIPLDANVVEAEKILDREELTVAAVVDVDQRYLGLVTAFDVQRHSEPQDPISVLVRRDIAPIRPREFLISALNHFMVNGIDALPVVAGGRVIGQLDRADIEAARHRHHISQETRQPGWISKMRNRDPGGESTMLAATPVLSAIPSQAATGE